MGWLMFGLGCAAFQEDEMTEQPLLKRLWASWVSSLDGLKSRLPESLQQRLSGLSNGALTGILLGIILLIGSIFSTLISPAPAPATVTSSPALPPQTETAFEVTPDPALIADIQDQVAAISDEFAAGVLQSVEAEFRQSCLIVTLGSQWYDLPDSRQDQLANELWQRTQQLSFENLQLRVGSTGTVSDQPDGALIARNPVVGDEMVILWRQQR